MIRRASRELSVETVKTFREEHQSMVDEFLRTHTIDEATQFIFKKIPDYISAAVTARVFEARNRKGELVAFDVAEFAAKRYAFYMFNFSSRPRLVPGVSDLLLFEIIQQAKKEDKRYINLGLGVHSGVTFFKEKWGGVPFLPYTFHFYTPTRVKLLEALLQKR
jgi:hypothetical protein